MQADCIATFDLDEVLDTLITDAPESVVAVVEEMAARRRRPPMTPAALLDR